MTVASGLTIRGLIVYWISCLKWIREALFNQSLRFNRSLSNEACDSN